MDHNAVERSRWGGPSPSAGQDSRTDVQVIDDLPENICAEIIRLSVRLPRDHPMRTAVACVPRTFETSISPFVEVTGRDTVATCLKHRREVRWIPAPGWWVHTSWYRGYRPEPDPTCTGMLAVPSPLVFFKPDGSVHQNPYQPWRH